MNGPCRAQGRSDEERQIIDCRPSRQRIIFTDLDGTLLDEDYSFEQAHTALKLIEAKGVPLVVCSSKTKTEIEFYRTKLNNSHPFISENGGGIFIPAGYFSFPVETLDYEVHRYERYTVIKLGALYADLRKALDELRQEGFNIRGFGDMTPGEVSGVTGLSYEEAVMSKERNFDETFLFHPEDEKDEEALFASIRTKGYRYTIGKFYHILGASDKGKAVSILTEIYRRQFGEIITYALGDSPNDIPMLEKVDVPVVVQRPDRSYNPLICRLNVIKADGVGPEGWNSAIVQIFAGKGEL